MTHGAHQGRVVGGRYRLDKTLHTGGFGRVWQARDLRGQMDVAVKEVWLPPMVSDAERNERLIRAEREARNATQLRNHPNIVTVQDVVAEDGVPWIVMQLVTGHSLAEDITASGPLSATQVGYVADGLLKALGAAHNAGIVHRDVKPANVMFTESGEVLLTDFGIAVRETDTTLTETGMIIGSVDYLAPERVHGRDSASPGDMFSLGVTLYQAVTGISPFHRDAVAATLAAILFEDPPPPRCPEGLARLIMRLLTKDPRQRPTVPVARALLAALSTNAVPIPTRPKPTLKAPAPPRPAPTKVAVPPKTFQPAPAQQRIQSPKPFQTRQAEPRLQSLQSSPAKLRFARPKPFQPAPERLRFQPPRRPASRIPARQRRSRPGSAVAVVLLVAAMGFFGSVTAWGRPATNATAGDCVYHRLQTWRLEPCSLPPPFSNAANFKVLQRVAGPPALCPGAEGDTTAVLSDSPPLTLCLAPMH